MTSDWLSFLPFKGLSIVVDENIPYALEAFGDLGGAVRRVHGRRISPADVRDADALIVRSITRVDEQLLAGSRVRFVGTATIGTDHVDVDYLRARGIAFASAPGSNAISVAEYIVAALLRSAGARHVTLEGATIAVIGVGNVGSRVADKARALGIRVVLNDPPRHRAEPGSTFVPLREALPQADYVTLHVPLVRGGVDATLAMARQPFFAAMRSGSVFLNTSRGPIVDEAALAAAIDSGHIAHAILDVWQHEPDIDPDMVHRAFIATAHIAGYSFDGKVAATEMICSMMVVHFTKMDCGFGIELSLPDPPVPRIDVTSRTDPDEDVLRDVVSAVYDIRADDRALREAMAGDTPGAHFDLLRKTYWQRREFCHTTVVMSADRHSLIEKVRRLGFAAETQ
jgi:erythronate-4-phosphate dehydrogenase